MKPAEFDYRIHCELAQSSATDNMVANAARVSTLGEKAEAADHDRDKGLVNFLMKNRHGTPFEHGMLTWRVKVPIFVMRELHRHRIASYNEESGRYTTLGGVFYVPSPARALTQVGKPGAYVYEQGSPEQVNAVQAAIRQSSEATWRSYNNLLEAGIAKEVARMVLPVNIYSSCYVTMNPRALMNFLSLRTRDPDSTFPSFPMAEIEILARIMEKDFEDAMPLTFKAFSENGRVSP